MNEFLHVMGLVFVGLLGGLAALTVAVMFFTDN